MKKIISTQQAKVAIIGAGFVGSTTAYTLLLDGAISHLALIDKDIKRAQGEALELQHCMQFAHSVHIEAGDSYELVHDAHIIVLCAGVGQQPGQTRFDILEKNVLVFKEIVPHIVRHNPHALLLVVTNPLDVMTYVTLQLSGHHPRQVFGSGTVLDTARLRYHVAQQFHVSPKDVVAHVIGEHGDSSLSCWHSASIAGIPLSRCPHYDPKKLTLIHQTVQQAVYNIISRKGATYYAIALVLTKIIRALLLDQARIFSVSSLIDGMYGLHNLCLSTPTMIGKEGIRQLLPLELSDEEKGKLNESAKKIKEGIDHALNVLNM